MNECKLSVELIAITPNAQALIERAGRLCYDSFDKITEGSDKRLIDHLIKSGHESVIEHASASFEVKGVSRALTHQLVRHRIASYSQRSQRYVAENNPSYVIPPSIVAKNLTKIYEETMARIWWAYSIFLTAGVKGEDARFVLPNGCETQIVITMNFREFRHFIKLRTSSHAQWEIRNMAQKIHEILVKEAPLVFSDLKFK